jgi:hypothetical protein
LDGYAASHRAVHEMKHDGLLPGDAKYLNKLMSRTIGTSSPGSTPCSASTLFVVHRFCWPVLRRFT